MRMEGWQTNEDGRSKNLSVKQIIRQGKENHFCMKREDVKLTPLLLKFLTQGQMSLKPKKPGALLFWSVKVFQVD